jgi:hypothetical protein
MRNILAAGIGRKLRRSKSSGAKRGNQMKMKTSLLVGAFSLALFIAGCTTAPAAPAVAGPAGPQGEAGAPGATGDPGKDADRHRTEEEKRLDDQKRADEVKRGDDQRRADEKTKKRQDAGCSAGEHVFTNADGRKVCVKD